MTETLSPATRVRRRTNRRIRVALSAIVLGSLGVLLAVVPGAALVAPLAAVLGGLMGVVGLHQKVADRWQAVAGLILAPIGIALSLATVLGVIRL